MSSYSHNGWPTKALGLLAKAKRLRETIYEGGQARASDNPVIKALEKEAEGLRARLHEIDVKVGKLRARERESGQEALQHIQVEVNRLTEEAKALKSAVPDRVNKFIEHITQGVNYSAGFQIVWWNKRFVIMRLPGRKFWGGIGMTSYARAETKMYDLEKFDKNRKEFTKGGTFGSLTAEKECTVHAVAGRISGKTLKGWKEEADFMVTGSLK